MSCPGGRWHDGFRVLDRPPNEAAAAERAGTYWLIGSFSRIQCDLVVRGRCGPSARRPAEPQRSASGGSTMTEPAIPKTVSREQWERARAELLVREKEHTH